MSWIVAEFDGSKLDLPSKENNAVHILIAGPSGARPFLEAIAEAVRDGTADVRCRYDLARPADYEDWAMVEILVAFAIPCSAEDMKTAPGLRAIVIPSLGYEGIDVASAGERGIAVANGRVVENFESVAEAAILYMLMTLYDIHAVEARLRSGTARIGPPSARMLKGRTVGLIGYGNIAQAIAARLLGWGVKILVAGRRRYDIDNPLITQTDLQTLLECSDIVLPLVPLTPETKHLLSKPELLAMKNGAVLINLSRGDIIDENALADPDVSAHLGGIALDVFEVEPLPMDNPLRQRAATILTSHEISHTQENLRALLQTTINNVQCALAGDPLLTRLG